MLEACGQGPLCNLSQRGHLRPSGSELDLSHHPLADTGWKLRLGQSGFTPRFVAWPYVLTLASQESPRGNELAVLLTPANHREIAKQTSPLRDQSTGSTSGCRGGEWRERHLGIAGWWLRLLSCLFSLSLLISISLRLSATHSLILWAILYTP